MTVVRNTMAVLHEVGGGQAVEAKLRRFEDDLRFLQSQEQLLRQYSESWVAVYEQLVVAHSKTLAGLWKQLAQKKIPSNEAVIAFLARERKAMLL